MNQNRYFVCARGLVEGTSGLRMQCFGPTFFSFPVQRWALWLAGCDLGAWWALEAIGPCHTHHKAFKIAKLNSEPSSLPSVSSKNYMFPPISQPNPIKIQIDPTRLKIAPTTNPFGF